MPTAVGGRRRTDGAHRRELPPGEAAPTEAPPPDAPANTVEEGLKKAGKAVSDTGDAVGHAMKKTWKCVTSLFGDC
jgi:hypothetical protein